MLRTWRRVRDYVKYDLKEIIFPSSLPYPPGEEELHKQKFLTWKVLKAATREYLDTWKPDKPEPSESKRATEEQPLAEELAGIARAGAGSAQPLLQHLYRTRAAAYRDAIREFVEGYREGYAGLPEKGDVDSQASAAPSSGKPKEAQSAAGQQEASVAGAQAAAEGAKGSQAKVKGHSSTAARGHMQTGPASLGATGDAPQPDGHSPGQR